MSLVRFPAFAILFVGACHPTYSQYTSDDTKTDTGVTDTAAAEEVVDDEYWSATRLVVLDPASGAFLPLGQVASFDAEVQDEAGDPVDFDEIDWSSDSDDAWVQTASTFEDDTLGVGTHTIMAQAELPNGDRLVYAVGGVLVQSEFAGTYTGTVQIDASFDVGGTAYTVSCSGATTLVVDQEGEVVEGESECLLSISGFDLDLSFDIDAENTEGEVTGSANASLYSFELTGSVTTDGVLELTFSDSLLGYLDMEGEIDAERLTREVTEI
jgi:hypothetical protein